MRYSQYKLIAIAFTLIVALLSTPFAHATEVTGYAPVFEPFEDNGVKIAIRRFLMDGKETVLWVDPLTLDTGITDAPFGAPTKADTRGTPYLKALDKFNAPPYLLQNHGLKRGQKDGGAFVSADLCPSTHKLDRSLFEALLGTTDERPIDVALAVSGRWITEHAADLDWIMELEEKGLIRVSWINHSHTHPFDSKVQIDHNFLLTPGVDFDAEVLKLEVALIEHGITPSPFFRFPGLVSDERLIKRLKALGLIPVGADAWLAKDEAPQDGSIILVHANGNEPLGIRKLKEILRANGKGYKFLRLRNAI